MSTPEPTEEVVRTYSLKGMIFTVIKTTYMDDPPEIIYDIKCPDGAALDNSDGYNHPPTDTEILDVAGIYISEVLPILHQNARDEQNSAPEDAPAGHGLYGGE